MIMPCWLALLAVQQPAPQPLLPQPIARVDIRPAAYALKVGDTLRLSATAYDSAGKAVDGVVFAWFTSGGFFEGKVDSTGLVSAGATGTLNVSAVARIPGRQIRPTIGLARITVLPLPAARIEVTPRPRRMLAGTSLVLEAEPYAANDDRRYDPVTWKSTRPAVVEVNDFGRLSARAPGQASVSVSGGSATERWTITVVPNGVARVGLAPGDTAIRTGDVVRFTFSATDAARRAVADARPEWSVAPVGSGYATIDGEGAFVANEPGVYRVAAGLGPWTAEAFVRVADRGITRPASVVGRLALKLPAAELWLHPDGKHAYISTIGDRIYAVDITDPSHPAVTDSVVVDARIVNDVMTTEDGKFGVMTREGASTRKNGIVILSFEDPAHPKPIAEFTETPQLVVQFKYDLNALYKKVELAGGPAFIRGTHTSWRHGRYVFVGDEVFPARQPGGGPGVIGLGRAYGRLHVIDISDLARPREVAWFEPEDGGSHNVWVAGDTLYLGDYQGGLRVLDISGELRGDLLAQGREDEHIHTGDKDGVTPNTANAWGAIYRDGLIYVPDINSGLWIVKIEPSQHVIP